MKSAWQLLTLIPIVHLTVTFSLVSAASVPGGDGVSGEHTTGDVIALILYVMLALLFSFLCSIAEAVLLNITPSYIADLQEKNPKFAEKVKKRRQDEIDQSLAAILTMNTMAHTIGAIGSGAKATIVFGSVWFGVFSAIMTLLILFLSEIIPKTIGVVYWRKLVKVVIRYIEVLYYGLYPMIWISEALTRLIAKERSLHGFNKDEFIAMAGVGEQTGEINYRESRILQNVFRLSSLTVEDIYTPRTVIMGFDQETTVSEVLNTEGSMAFSRIVIHEGDLDKITGFVLKDELLLLKSEGKGDTVIKNLKRDIIAVPITYSLSRLLEIFLQDKQQIAQVIDEYGTKGLVTIEDVLETLLGMEIIDESDDVDDMRILARQIWEQRMKDLGVELPSSSDENQNNS